MPNPRLPSTWDSHRIIWSPWTANPSELTAATRLQLADEPTSLHHCEQCFSCDTTLFSVAKPRPGHHDATVISFDQFRLHREIRTVDSPADHHIPRLLARTCASCHATTITNLDDGTITTVDECTEFWQGQR